MLGEVFPRGKAEYTLLFPGLSFGARFVASLTSTEKFMFGVCNTVNHTAWIHFVNRWNFYSH